MPCYDSRDHEPSVVYKDGVSPEIHNDVIDERDQLRGMLCAIITVLDSKGTLFSIINTAEKNGSISIMPWFEEHKKRDKVRLSKVLNKYSEDEKTLLFELLTGE